MNKIIFTILSLSLFLTACTKYENYLIIGDTKINLVGIADTQEKAYMGLSFRDAMCKNCGMLFPFEKKREHSFVMRDMMFSLDIVWIDENRIVKIDKNLEPEGHETEHVYGSGQAINNVLELNGGFTDRHNIKVGDEIHYNLGKK